MIRSILIASWRFYRRHPAQLILAVLGAALGVAVFVGVELANESARLAFAESEMQLAGPATHQLVGVGQELPEQLYRDLRLSHGPIRAAPVVEAAARIGTRDGRQITLLGIDPLEEIDFRSYAGGPIQPGSSSARLMAEPETILVPAALAAELGLSAGDTLNLSVDGGHPRDVTVIGTIGGSEPDTDDLNLPLVADIATVEELRGRDTLTRVDLILTAEEAETLQRLGLPGTALVPAPSRSAVFNELSRAFRINLTALSLLALLVGVFLIYATMSFAVLQRRAVFGIYRALGVSRRQLLVAILTEASVIGAVATLIGIAIGSLLSRGLVDLVLRTIGDLYFSAAVRASAPSLELYAVGFAVGMGTSLLAACLPALEATRVSPRTVMSRVVLERSAGKLSRWGATLAIPCFAAGMLAMGLAPRSIIGAFIGLFLVILAGALATPICAAAMLRGAAPSLTRLLGVAGALAARGVSAALSRTGVAAAALAVAVATVIGVGLMIGSFRTSVEQWLASTLLADFYADVEGWSASAEDPLQNSDLAAIAMLPGVRGLSLMQFTRLPTAAGDISLRAVRPGPDGWGLTIIEPKGGDVLGRLAVGDGVLVSEALSYRNDLAVGDMLELPTREGITRFQVLGVYREYNTDGGGVLMPMQTYQAYWGDHELDGLGIYVDPEADRAGLQTALEARLQGAGELGARLRSTRAIRLRSLEIFDRTFQITEVLRILAGIVAFFGLLSALLAIELDRGKEIAVLRALGFTPRRVATLAIAQTVLLGTVTGLLAIPLGIVMAALLVDVINRRSFGWGMDLTLHFQPLALGLVLAVTAAVAAGIYPALRLSRSNVVARLREE